MPIQFRSRSVPFNSVPVQYSDQTSESTTGWCCGSGSGSGGNKTFYECKAANGYWIKGAVDSSYCPDADTGCDITPGYNNTPGACCYWIKYGAGTGFENICENVANEIVCKNLHEGQSQNLTYNYWPGGSCESGIRCQCMVGKVWQR